jgi:hypothetical protein
MYAVGSAFLIVSIVGVLTFTLIAYLLTAVSWPAKGRAFQCMWLLQCAVLAAMHFAVGYLLDTPLSFVLAGSFCYVSTFIALPPDETGDERRDRAGSFTAYPLAP